MLKRLLTNSAVYGIAPYIPRIVSIFILPVLTQHLTDVDYGIAGTISAYTSALIAFSTLGFNVVLQVSFYKCACQYKILWREIYGFLQYWMILFSVLQSIILFYIIPEEAAENKWSIILLTNFNGVVCGPAGLLGPLYYQLIQKPIPIAVRNVASGLLTVLINYILIVVLEQGYMGWYVSSFLGTFLVNVSYWYDLNFKLSIRPIFRFKIRTIIKNLKVSLPTIPHYYSIFLINTSNRVVMDRVNMPISAIGEFNMAQNFSSIIDSAVNAVNMAINPMCMQEIRNNREQESRRIIYLFFILTLSITTFFSIWSKEIFSLLIKNEVLANTYPYAAVLALSLNYRPMYIAASNMFFYYEKTLKLLFITFTAGIIALIGNILFIPVWGIWAAVIINYVAFLYMGYSGFLFDVYKKNTKVHYPVITAMLIQVGLSCLCFCVLDSPITVKVLISVCLGIIYMFYFYKYSKS